MTLSRTVIILMVVLALFQYAHYEPRLPDRVASHYNAAGEPDEWTSKTGFLIGSLALVGGFAVLFLGLTAVVRRIPNEWINMPNRDYWLAPDRRAETLRQLQQQMEWLGAATLALFLGIGQLSIEANLAARPLDNARFWTLFTAFGVAMALWLVGLLRWAFRRPPRGL